MPDDELQRVVRGSIGRELSIEDLQAEAQKVNWLQGAGFGLSYNVRDRLSVRASWAHVLGDNPGRSTSGNNIDGKADQSRFWLSTIMYF